MNTTNAHERKERDGGRDFHSKYDCVCVRVGGWVGERYLEIKMYIWGSIPKIYS